MKTLSTLPDINTLPDIKRYATVPVRFSSENHALSGLKNGWAVVERDTVYFSHAAPAAETKPSESHTPEEPIPWYRKVLEGVLDIFRAIFSRWPRQILTDGNFILGKAGHKTNYSEQAAHHGGHSGPCTHEGHDHHHNPDGSCPHEGQQGHDHGKKPPH